MKEIQLKRISQWLTNPKIILALILMFALVTRVGRLWVPQEYYFDEVYHAFTAKAYAENDPRGYEWWNPAPEGLAYEWLHPPISKLLMGLAIKVGGHESWVWRLPSAIFGTGVVAAVYWVAKGLWGDRERLALIAALMASLEGLLLVQSRIAMNDIFLVFFVLLALGWYWRWQKQEDRVEGLSDGGWQLWLAGAMTGLAIATKWSGVFVLGAVGIWELGRVMTQVGEWRSWWLAKKNRTKRAAGANEDWAKTKREMRGVWNRWVKLGLAFGVLPVMIYVLSYGQFWWQGHTVEQFVELHNQIWWYETTLEATHPYQSRPWEWVLNQEPVWYFVDYTQDGWIGHIYALANPVVAWLGLVAMGWLLVVVIKKQKVEGLWVWLCYLMFWTPWLASPRIMFFYHYAPAMAMLTVGLGWGVDWLWRQSWRPARVVAVGVVMAAAIAFGYFYPLWTGILVPSAWAEQYFWMDTWK